MNDNYWVKFWRDYGAKVKNEDEQTQVLRTNNKKPVSKELWENTLKEIEQGFKVQNGDKIIELCSGNGLISRHLANQGAQVVAVDISLDLLASLEGVTNVECVNQDIRFLKFDEESFDKIIIYAGIQYLSDKDTLMLLNNVYDWLKPSGCFYIGDIPDLDKRWEFFNSKGRVKDYFDHVLNNTAIIGNWFKKDWFLNATDYIGFTSGKCLIQSDKLLNYKHRFDFIFIK